MHDTKHRTAKTTSADSLRRLVDESLAAWEPTFAALDDAWSAWTNAAAEVGGRPRRRGSVGRRGCGCGCEDGCGDGGCDDGGHRHGDCRSGHRHRGKDRCDHCACCSCAEGADVLIEARVGERRVVPLTLHNPRRRAVTATLQPGEWTSCSDNAPAIVTRLVPSGEVALEPCESRQVQLVIEVGGQGSTDDKQDVVGDVRCCTVFVSDIRVDGCGTTVRLAVAVFPSDCGDLEVTCCGCGC
jgi:hypothetical protein